MLALGDRSNFRRDDGSYDQINYSFPAVRCLDSQDDSVREAEKRYDHDLQGGAGARTARWGRSDLRALARRPGAAAAEASMAPARRRSW